MAIFTAIAAAIGLTGFFAAAFVTAASLATSIGLSYAVRALSGQPKQSTDSFGVQGKLTGGGDVPRSFGLGRHVTAGSLVYANTWGNGYDTPNAFLTQVIALSDLPGERLVGMWVNGAKVTLAEGDAKASVLGAGSQGYAVPEYIRPHNGEGAAVPHLWVKFYDGSQTGADTFTLSASSAERPYTAAHVGKGVCYAVVHAFNDENLWSGFPTLKFELSGVPLYDPSKDSTVGGSGAHRYGDPSTWGGDGDDFPVVQIHNILRGFSYNGIWLYGLQNTSAARLPAVNWITQIGKCRTTVVGAGGPEPTYRTGGQIDVNAQPANAIEAILTGCQGRLSEIGGFYKIHVGAPDTPSFTFSDDDILSTEPQTYRPFFSLSDSVNGIQATYPDPAQGWNSATAPAYYRTDLEARDGGRRLMANPAFDFVPYAEQVQRLQKSAIEEAQRARTHALTLPPAFWIVEPGDVGEWTSLRNGYSAKQFRVDSAVDKANLDVMLAITEVDPSDYDWNTGTDFTPVTGGGTVSNPPAPQGIASFDALPYSLVDDSGIIRRPAILISWDGSQPGISGVQFEVRLASDGSSVTRGRTDRVTAGNLIVTQSILPAVTYQVRGQYIPSAPRDMLWSGWITVTTPDVRFTLAEFDAAVAAQVTTLQNQLNDNLALVEQTIANVAAGLAARDWRDKKELRSQLSARSDDALAQIDDVRTVAVDTQTAFASFSTTATATFGSTTAFVSQTAAAIATYDGWGAAQYAVTLNVDGYATGFNLVNGGSGTSAFTIVADKFQVQLPGYNGSAPQPVFTIGTLNGVAAVGLTGNVYLDGTLNARAIVAGSILASKIAAGEITSDSGVIGALALKSLSIADNAATVPAIQILASNTSISGGTNFFNFNLSVDTTGLSGKTIPIFASITFKFSCSYAGAGTQTTTFYLYVNGSIVDRLDLQCVAGLYILSMSGGRSITGTGGIVSVPIVVQGFAGGGADVVNANACVFAMAAKR
ncbi:phage tail protein [Bradyrhizobium cosmicum]|uniref:phage tail protein n=1 Tax=Bradyrhizobium cosmicum TaxID=1404864 RepID=UPI00116569CC|nr:phage tail protein [Bradyrhizobium cosmicum]QDP20657.1 DUF1983 domain-containing protein [Bradyrhizobium cosmicum]QDP27007.1 DUF1983 domain-containing protein [Bradyrhizobium cosmicum]